jgi:hypothetical protein
LGSAHFAVGVSHKPETNLLKEENGNLAVSYNILNWLKNYFSQLLKVHGLIMSGNLKDIQLSH